MYGMSLSSLGESVLRAWKQAESLAKPPKRPLGLRGLLPARPPASYVRHAGEGWELHLPKEWIARPGRRWFAESARMGSFVEVAALEGAGSRPGLPEGAELLDVRRGRERLSMRLRLKGRTFDVDAVVRTAGTGTLVLLLGNVVDPARGRLLELAEDRTLRAIRRSFRAYLPSR